MPLTYCKGIFILYLRFFSAAPINERANQKEQDSNVFRV